METTLNYGNWVRKKNLLILGLVTLGIGALSFVPLGNLFHIIAIILFIIIFLSFLFPLYAYIMFSQNGGKFQEKVYTLNIERLGQVKGKILDIGSGNGVLAIKLALQNKEARVTGVDYWGTDWEYSKGVCEANARLAQVENRIRFQKGDAAKLDFPTETFDGAISNLTFHEVQSVPDKREIVREALRVVKPGGRFAFIDYFFETKYYGSPKDFEQFLRDLGVSQFEYKPLREVIEMPFLLRHPKILGRVGIIYGKK